MSTARLSTYIEKAHHETGSFRRERIFDYGLAHTAPYLERDRVNRILVYPGSFNPPHNGHNTSLSHAFNNSGCDLNLIAAIIIPLDDIIITDKVGNHKGAIVLTKEQHVALWRGESGLEPGPSFWVFDRSTNEWKSFQRRLAQAVSADGFETDFVVLCGPDKVAVNKQPPIPCWGCKHVIVSDVGRPADFASRASNLSTEDSWRLIKDFWLILSHGLIVSGAILWSTSTELRLLDLERNQQIMSSLCRLHAVLLRSSYVLCQTRVRVSSCWMYW